MVWGIVLLAGVCSALLLFTVYRAQHKHTEPIYQNEQVYTRFERVHDTRILEMLHRAAHATSSGGLMLIWGVTAVLLQWEPIIACIIAVIGLIFATFGYVSFNASRSKLELRGYRFPHIHLSERNQNILLPWGHQPLGTNFELDD